MSYKVKLNLFEGPLDLLLFLIKKEKIDIHDIPIAKITEQYLSYLEVLQLLDLNLAGEFLLMAATLIHIKSKTLLPPEENPEEEVAEEDPREELVRRLLEYKKFKEATRELQEMRDRSRSLFMRKGEGERNRIFVDGGEYFEASLFDLISAFKKVLANVSKQKFHEVVKNKFTVKDKIHYIYHLLAQEKKVLFSALFQGATAKDEVIATFLAVLELMKLREIMVVQKSFFDEIEIIRNPEIAAGAPEVKVPETNAA